MNGDIRLEMIFEVVTAFSGERDYYKLLDVVITKMMAMTRADAGTLYIRENNALHFRIVRNVSLGIYQSPDDTAVLPPVALDGDVIDNASAYAAINNEIVTVDDVYCDKRFNFNGPKRYDTMTGYRTKSMLVLPLAVNENGADRVIGVIQLINAEGGSFGDVYHPPVLPALANIAANTLAGVMHAEEIKRLFNSFVAVMTQAIDERSRYNSNHTRNVAAHCDKFSRYLGRIFPQEHELHFDDARRERLVMAALLHDIGKIITPLEIMDKPTRLGSRIEAVRYRFELARRKLENDRLAGRIGEDIYRQELGALENAMGLVEVSNTAGFLPDETLERLRALSSLVYTDASGESAPILSESDMDAITIRKGTLTETERGIMQEHAALTGRLLDRMTFNEYYRDVPAWAQSHHELLDGSGYPSGTGDICVETRILTIADIYEALTAGDRPYKKAVPKDKALEILSSMAGEGKLDRALVGLFAEAAGEDE